MISHQINDREVDESDLPVFEGCLYLRGSIHLGPDIPYMPDPDLFL
jgi:hypothetical protein